MEDLTGKQLGPYQVTGPLGAGGMAAVFKAYQPGMDRHVALKVLPQFFAGNKEFVKRFEREAKVIANLQHPRIVPVHDYGEAEGYNYLVMSLVETGTLADMMTKRPLSLDEARDLLSQVGDALDYAHSKGVVHRDIKPSNVLLDSRGNCLLTDFGIAKMVEGMTEMTKPGGILGTPSYMSPEQGLGEDLDGRSDIYALGVILYHMATGRLPYTAETPLATVMKHVNDPLPVPTKIKADLPAPVEAVILKAMAKKKEDRFPTAGAFVKALEAAIPKGGGPVDEATLAATLAVTAEDIKVAAAGGGPGAFLRSPRALGAAAAALAAIAALFFLLRSPGPDGIGEGPSPALVEPEARTPYEKGYRALRHDQIDEAETIFSDITAGQGEDSWQGTEGLAAVAYEKKDYPRALDLAGEVLTAQPEGAYAFAIKGNVHFAMGKIQEATVSYKEALRIDSGAPWQKAVPNNYMGRIMASAGSGEEAMTYYDRAIALDPSYAEAYANKGVLLASMNQPGEALESYRLAVEHDPQDLLAEQLLREMEDRQDAEKQKARSETVQRLAVRFKESKGLETTGGDDWTTRAMPWTIAFLPLETTEGPPSMRDGAEDYLAFKLAQELPAEERLSVVDRMEIDEVLQELELSSSELTSKDVRNRLGKLWGAYFLATGTLNRSFGLLTLRLLETETSRVLASFEREVDLQDLESIREAASGLAAEINGEMVSLLHPLQGLVDGLEEENVVRLNLGARHGVSTETVLRVYDEEAREVALLQVTGIEDTSSTASVLKLTKDRTIVKGMKVKEAEKMGI